MKKYDNTVTFKTLEKTYGAVCEYRFHPERRWRFDVALPKHRVAVEIEGGVWTEGRHTRGSGFVKDMEKYNAAAMLGWRVLRYTPSQFMKTSTVYDVVSAVNWRSECITPETTKSGTSS